MISFELILHVKVHPIWTRLKQKMCCSAKAEEGFPLKLPVHRRASAKQRSEWCLHRVVEPRGLQAVYLKAGAPFLLVTCRC